LLLILTWNEIILGLGDKMTCVKIVQKRLLLPTRDLDYKKRKMQAKEKRNAYIRDFSCGNCSHFHGVFQFCFLSCSEYGGAFGLVPLAISLYAGGAYAG